MYFVWHLHIIGNIHVIGNADPELKGATYEMKESAIKLAKLNVGDSAHVYKKSHITLFL
jgi:hypothetical protein